MDYRAGIVACLGVALSACGGDIKKANRDATTFPMGGTGGGAGGTPGQGGSGGLGGGGGGAASDGGIAPDRPPVDAGTPPDGGTAPSAQFVMIYDTILKPRCSPCHVTNMPRSGMFDLGDVMTAFTTLTTGSTACATASPKEHVLATRADDSYLIKKLIGAPGICGMRMPRGCIDQVDGGTGPDAADGSAADSALPADAAADDAALADAAESDAADGAPDAAPVDAAVADAGVPDAGGDAPRASPACLSPEAVATLKAWINGLSKVRSLVVHDPVYGGFWALQTNLQTGQAGARPWWDYPNAYIVAVDPPVMGLIGKPWVRVHAQSKSYVGGPQATLTLAAPADVYLVVDDRWLTANPNPPWLAGWTDSGHNFTVFENNTRPMLPFSLFKQTVATAGTVTVPPIGATTAFDYFIVVD